MARRRAAPLARLTGASTPEGAGGTNAYVRVASGRARRSGVPGNKPRTADLVERAKSDPAAFGELYDQHVDDVYRFVVSRVRNSAVAEDITAEVFFKALKKINGYADRGRSFSSWLYRIAANQTIDHYRRDHPALDLTEAASATPGNIVLEEVIHRDQIHRAYAAIDGLPPAQRLAMRLRFSEDRSCADVGRIIGKSEAAVKLLVYRAVRRLRRDLADQG